MHAYMRTCMHSKMIVYIAPQHRYLYEHPLLFWPDNSKQLQRFRKSKIDPSWGKWQWRSLRRWQWRSPQSWTKQLRRRNTIRRSVAVDARGKTITISRSLPRRGSCATVVGPNTLACMMASYMTNMVASSCPMSSQRDFCDSHAHSTFLSCTMTLQTVNKISPTCNANHCDHVHARMMYVFT